MGNNNTIQKQKIVKYVDLPSYEGYWYEIARKPNFFEPSGAMDIKAQYKLLPDGTLSVLNSEVLMYNSNRITTEKRGIAYVTNTDTNSQLSVRFQGVLFEGQYWIVRLLGDRPRYTDVVVTNQGGSYLWILSRTPKSDNLEYLKNSLIEEGYDLSDLIYCKHTSKNVPVFLDEKFKFLLNSNMESAIFTNGKSFFRNERLIKIKNRKSIYEEKKCNDLVHKCLPSCKVFPDRNAIISTLSPDEIYNLKCSPLIFDDYDDDDSIVINNVKNFIIELEKQEEVILYLEMDFIKGKTLVEFHCNNERKTAIKESLKKAINEMLSVYKMCGFVHSNMTEEHIIIKDDNSICLLDLEQSEGQNHEQLIMEFANLVLEKIKFEPMNISANFEEEFQRIFNS